MYHHQVDNSGETMYERLFINGKPGTPVGKARQALQEMASDVLEWGLNGSARGATDENGLLAKVDMTTPALSCIASGPYKDVCEKVGHLPV